MSVGQYKVTVDTSGGLDSFLNNPPPVANANTQNSLPIEWEVFSIDLSSQGNSASIGFKLSELGFQFYNYKGATVKIEIWNAVSEEYDPLFWGLAKGQSVNKTSCTLSIEGFEQILDEVPLIGANRQKYNFITEVEPGDEISEFSYESISIFNENDQLDQFQGTAGAAYRNVKSSDTTGSPVKDRWNKLRVASYYLEEILGHNSNQPIQGLKDYIDSNDLGGYIRINFNTNANNKPIDSEYQRATGAVSELRAALDEEQKILFFYPLLSLGVWDYFYYIKDRFDATNKKQIDYDFTASVTTASILEDIYASILEDIYWDISLNYDYNRPDAVYAMSKKEIVNTHICIDPSKYGTDAGDYGVEVERDEAVSFLRFAHVNNFDQTDPVLGSDVSAETYTIKDLFGPAKQELITAVYSTPIETVDTTTGTYTFRDDKQMIFFKFKSGYALTGLTGDYILMKSELWETLKASNVGPTNDKESFAKIASSLEALEYRLLQDRVGLEIDGFDNINNAGTLVADYTPLTKYVDKIIIPFAMELERRRTVVSERTLGEEPEPAIETIETIETEVDDSNIPATNYIKQNADLIMSEYVKPIRYVKGFESWDSTGIILQSGAAYDYDGIDRLETIASSTLKRGIIDSGDSLTINIPVEFFPSLPDTYPKKIGDWVASIKGINGASTQALNKPMTLESINYDRYNVTLNFR